MKVNVDYLVKSLKEVDNAIEEYLEYREELLNKLKNKIEKILKNAGISCKITVGAEVEIHVKNDDDAERIKKEIENVMGKDVFDYIDFLIPVKKLMEKLK